MRLIRPLVRCLRGICNIGERPDTGYEGLSSDELMASIDDGLRYCQKEARYIVGGPEHHQAERRARKVREALEDVDAALEEVERRAEQDGDGDP